MLAVRGGIHRDGEKSQDADQREGDDAQCEDDFDEGKAGSGA
jgi:hypothetical protein